MGTAASGVNAGNRKHNMKAQKSCRQRFLSMFVEKGYSDKFEFIGGYTSSRGKAVIRCRLCGCVFMKAGSFVQQGINIRCDGCRIQLSDKLDMPRDGRLAEHLAERYEAGETIRELSALTGMGRKNIARLIKLQGVEVKARLGERVRAEMEAAREKKAKAAALKRFVRELAKIGKAKAKVEANREKREAERLRRERRAAESFAPIIAVCKECGRTWAFYPSGDRYGRRVPPRYCCKRCARKHNKVPGNIASRLSRYDRRDEPRDHITLREVFLRDKGVCQICGMPVSWNDVTKDSSGRKLYVNDRYPSIDHIVPLAKGGTHTWDNVQLAHKICNSRKGDRVTQ